MMKVAMLAPIAWRTPPVNYGPWEQVTSLLTEALVKKGLDVTLFATGNSVTSAKLEWTSQIPYEEDLNVDVKVVECLHISNLMERSHEFDIIHNQFDFLPLTYSRLIPTPMVTTIHGFSSEKIVPVYKKYNSSSSYVSISDSNRHPSLSYVGTVYHGIDSEAFAFSETKDDYVLFFGRIHPDKGTHSAIEIAKRAGIKLLIAGLIQDELYFSGHIAPHVDDNHVIYLGNVNQEKGALLLAKAKALLHPIYFEEPFGLSVAEAQMCGTPVIAFNRGSMPELIEDGITGFLVNTVEEALVALKNIDTLNRSYCRNRAIEKFSVSTMADHYIKIYKNAILNPKNQFVANLTNSSI